MCMAVACRGGGRGRGEAEGEVGGEAGEQMPLVATKSSIHHVLKDGSPLCM